MLAGPGGENEGDEVEGVLGGLEELGESEGVHWLEMGEGEGLGEMEEVFAGLAEGGGY